MRSDFEMDGVKLGFPGRCPERNSFLAIKQKTGARGLRAIYGKDDAADYV